MVVVVVDDFDDVEVVWVVCFVEVDVDVVVEEGAIVPELAALTKLRKLFQSDPSEL